jgi:hypothetical protein
MGDTLTDNLATRAGTCRLITGTEAGRTNQLLCNNPDPAKGGAFSPRHDSGSTRVASVQRLPALENPKQWQHVRDSESVESAQANTGNGGGPSDYLRPKQLVDTCQQPRPTGQHGSQISPTGSLQRVIQFT